MAVDTLERPSASSSMGLDSGAGNPAPPQVNGTPAPQSGSTTPQGMGDGVKDAVAQEWLNAGYPPAAVSGIMRRINVESGFDPYQIGDGGTSLSLYQHHADRAQKLAQYLQANQVNTSDPVELARATTKFAISEMNGGDPIAARHRDELMKATDPNAAYGIFTSSFERPAGSPGSEETNLKSTALGGFNSTAQAFLSQWQKDVQRRGQEYDSAIAESKDLHRAAGAALERWEAESDRPPQNMRDAWNQWSGVASALAIFGGVFGHHQTAALGAAGEMLQAANAADVLAYNRSYQLWKDHQERGLKLIELLHNDARDIVEDAAKSYDRKVSELTTLSNAYQLQKQLDPNSVENLEKNIQLQKSRRDLITAQNTDAEVRLAVEEKDKAELEKHPEWNGQVPPDVHNQHVGEAKREQQFGSVGKPSTPHEIEIVDSANKVVRSGSAYRDAMGQLRWDGTNEPVDVPAGASLHQKSIAQPRSANAMAVQKFKEENPDASSDDIIRFRSKMERAVAVERAFGSGAEAKNVTSLNTVADHLETFEEVANALQNGDYPRLNALRNRVRLETGDDRPLDFAVVQQIASREISKAVVGGPGAAEDRQAIAAQIDNARSPEQLAGAFKFAKQLVAGRLDSLGRQYAGSDPERRKVFEEEMLSPIARKELLSVSREHQQGGSSAPVVGAIEGGYRFKGGDPADPKNWEKQ